MLQLWKIRRLQGGDSKMKAKAMTSCANKMEIWVDKDVHKILKKDAAETGSTISKLATLAIQSYYRSITRDE